ncbi:hypothetical protein [Undibacterium pigrum]|uniref:Uncharacterized protein n=1 Tax=Undibacterium pigrum TaxID=401470 RepID=A0A318J104_9BURK|nr:hypothetical protein [Undibacterium pigrum]PXX41419.1 hypothetical protein DFR42_10770 [Undibacterium pigrum]
MTIYTPHIFAMRQMLYRAMPLVVLLLAFFVVYLFIGNQFNTIIVILSSGGLAFVYLGWFLSAYSKGLIDTPRRQWHVVFENGMIKINAMWGSTDIPLDLIKSLTLVCDDNWDLIKGLEEQCLKVVPLYGFSIIIPGSSANFDATLEAIKQFRQVDTVLVN